MGRSGVVASEEQVATFFAMRDSGSSIEKAAKAAGVAKPTGQRWIDERDSSRWQIRRDAIGLETHLSLRQIGDRIGRHKSVVKREMGRNRNRDGSYRGYSAQQRADLRAGPRNPPSWPSTSNSVTRSSHGCQTSGHLSRSRRCSL